MDVEFSDNFSGAKLAYIVGDSLLVYRRDDKPSIPFPNQWDFPGGGREGNETPEKCVLRELEEEFGLALSESRLIYKKQELKHAKDGVSFFFGMIGNQTEVDGITFGSEGQFWQLMPIQKYLENAEGIVDLKNRLRRFIGSGLYI